ncbi:hypothetical protein AAFF_G00273810 [Aldrovandia affinis]|uniref:Uncharacterized protein n=1 Tax=Aldrovandia affinis TaxID=143900 RepID=A0AAD7SRJ4_9TELE|nr:hypothetical protein AAFF_G00273810 [Aldrovandia affinis]
MTPEITSHQTITDKVCASVGIFLPKPQTWRRARSMLFRPRSPRCVISSVRHARPACCCCRSPPLATQSQPANPEERLGPCSHTESLPGRAPMCTTLTDRWENWRPGWPLSQSLSDLLLLALVPSAPFLCHPYRTAGKWKGVDASPAHRHCREPREVRT